MIKQAILASALAITTACATAPAADISSANREDAAASIRAVLETQMAAWNRGDIEAFMEGYWKSPNMRFASGGNVTRGWQGALERYLRNYPDRSAMGELSFSDIEVDVLSDDAAILHGRWELTREADAPWGLYTLVFRKIGGTWVIASDTTTSGTS